MRPIASAAVLACVTLWPAPARANGPAPCTVWIHEAAGRAAICPSASGCPGDGLLRRDVDSGGIVLVTTCEGAGENACYLDECVPAGTHEYGLRTPYACCASGSYWYETMTTVGAPEACVRTQPAPVPASSVPWSSERRICESTYGQRGAKGCSSAGAVFGLDGCLAALGLAALLRRRRR